MSSNPEGRMTRTTLALTEGIVLALDCYAFESGIPKGEIIRNAIRNYLIDNGWDPSRMPSMVDRLKRSRYPS